MGTRLIDTADTQTYGGRALVRLRAAAAQALAAMIVVLVALVASPASAQPAAAPNSCATCHATLSDQRLSVPALTFTGPDVHREKGFQCVDCHGGNPKAADKVQAHDVSGRDSVPLFRGKPAGSTIVTTCARCHSDAELMRRFAPKQRIDQATEYATSAHGKRLATGDVKVATCASCHGAHGIRLVSDAKSPVYPTNVAATCATCHADGKHMTGYKLADGSPLPTHQFADYQKSIHYTALTKGSDLSAPTCNDCHGNHGAAPPGVGAIANVCGTCHAIFAQKFEGSVHQQIFDKGCVECHGNHAVLKPSDDMLGATGHAICATCHSGADDKGAKAAEQMRGGIERLKAGVERSGALVARIRNAGIEVSDDELALREARMKLTLARTELHAANPAAVDSVLADGHKIVAEVDRSGERGLAELSFRRRGLAVSLVAILMVVVGLALKLRHIDRDLRREP